jgi:hypothetical protein
MQRATAATEPITIPESAPAERSRDDEDDDEEDVVGTSSTVG